jgi:hypothetical protein
MIILNTTAALIEEIVERGLRPIEYHSSVYRVACVGCEIEEIEATLDLPQMDAFVTHCIAYNGRHFVAYWPAARWDESVAEYAAGVANATALVAGNTCAPVAPVL